MAVFIERLESQEIPKNNIKLAYFDIDGTLLVKSGKLLDTTKEAIVRLREAGVKIAIASGRPAFATNFLNKELGVNAPGVYCTGAHLYDVLNDQTLFSNALSQVSCKRLLNTLREANVYYELYTEKDYYYETTHAEAVRLTHAQHLRVEPKFGNMEDIIISQRVIKFQIGIDESREKFSLAELEASFPELIFAYARFPAFPTWSFVSIIDRAAKKEAAFEWLLEYHKISSSNVIAFGDSRSDIDFLRMAGIGVAMGNAESKVREQANFITRSVEEDGVGYALSRLCHT